MFSLSRRENYWLPCLPSGTTKTWTDLEDKFLERFFPNAPFVERRSEIENFSQGDIESLYEAWEKFKILLISLPNLNMEHMQHFTRCLKSQAIVLLDAYVGGTIRTKNEDKLKELIDKMFHNEYYSQR